MKTYAPTLASLTLTSLLLTGCAGAAGSPTAATPPVPHSASSTTAPPDANNNHTGGHHSSPQQAPARTNNGPSDAAKMVCGDQPMERLTAILHLTQKPHTINTWADRTFTCTYHLTEGALDISVREAPDQAKALTYFDAMQALAKDATTIKGLANLGFPAYETPDGTAVFQKDNFILTVNASALPATLGPDAVTRNALAYQLSTTILACWIEHH